MTTTDVAALPELPTVEDLFSELDEVDQWNEEISDYHTDQEWADAGTYE